MATRSFITLIVSSVILTLCSSCSSRAENNLQDALKLYRENKLDKALVYFEREVQQNQNNADAFSWLAETYRRLGHHQKAAEAARKSIALNPINSFAHTVLADTYNPQYSSWKETHHDTTWQHLLLAIKNDSNDGNAWLSLWIEAMRRGNDALWKESLHSMVRTKFLTPSVIAYNRWVLKQLPENSILFTNGDMDTYPAVALQVTEGLRMDVAIINISLLNMPWYARFISRHYNIALPFKSAELDSLQPMWGPNKTVITISKQIITAWLKEKEAKRLSTPITFAVTVDINLLEDIKNHMKLAGSYSLWQPGRFDNFSDTTLIRMSVEGIQPRDFTGPFISAQDRSPIRIGSEKSMSGIVVNVIMNYAGRLIEAKRFKEASRTLDLAEDIDKNFVSGRMFGEQISKLRKAIGK